MSDSAENIGTLELKPLPYHEAMCAYQLERVLTNPELALRLSRESRRIASDRNDRERIVQRQLEIYRQVVEAR